MGAVGAHLSNAEPPLSASLIPFPIIPFDYVCARRLSAWLIATVKRSFTRHLFIRSSFSSDDRQFVWGVVTYSVQEHWKSINHG
jgi:hypothetical protein